MRSLHPIIPTTLLMAAACGGPTVDLEAERATLHARSEALVAAEAAQDLETVLTFWAPDAVVQPAGTPQIRGIDAVEDLYRSFFDSGVLKEFQGTATHLHVAASGDLAWETGVNRMVLAGPEGDLLDVGKYLVIWEKRDGEWYVAALSFTSDAPEPTPVPGG